jgi:hypothetical protein
MIWSGMANETIRQLELMGAMLDDYEDALTPIAAGRIYDWLDGVNIFQGNDSDLSRKSRKEQAEQLLNWFEERIADKKAGITP